MLKEKAVTLSGTLKYFILKYVESDFSRWHLILLYKLRKYGERWIGLFIISLLISEKIKMMLLTNTTKKWDNSSSGLCKVIEEIELEQ